MPSRTSVVEAGLEDRDLAPAQARRPCSASMSAHTTSWPRWREARGRGETDVPGPDHRDLRHVTTSGDRCAPTGQRYVDAPARCARSGRRGRARRLRAPADAVAPRAGWTTPRPRSRAGVRCRGRCRAGGAAAPAGRPATIACKESPCATPSEPSNRCSCSGVRPTSARRSPSGSSAPGAVASCWPAAVPRRWSPWPTGCGRPGPRWRSPRGTPPTSPVTPTRSRRRGRALPGDGGSDDVDCVLLAAGVLGDQDHLADDPTAAAELTTANYTGAVVDPAARRPAPAGAGPRHDRRAQLGGRRADPQLELRLRRLQGRRSTASPRASATRSPAPASTSWSCAPGSSTRR